MTESTIHLKGDEYEVYNTRNPMLRLLNARFLSAVSNALMSISASDLLGLDIGCGEGQMLDDLRARGSVGSITAVDLDMQRLSRARNRNPKAVYVGSDVNLLPFPDGAFDYVLAAEVLEHLPDPGRAMRELMRVTKTGAKLVATVPHEPYFHWGNLVRGKHRDNGGWTPAHVNRWRREEFRRFLERFASVETEARLATFPWLLCVASLGGGE